MIPKSDKNILEEKYGSDLAEVVDELSPSVLKTAKGEDDLYNKLYKDVYEKREPDTKAIESIRKFFEGIEKVEVKIIEPNKE